MLNRFLRDRCGQMAVITALLAIPLFGVTGIALDLANASWRKASLQNAADAAILAAAASGETTLENLTRVAEKFFAGSLGKQGFGTEKLSLEINAGGKLTVTVTATAPVTLASLIKPGGIPITVSSSATPGRSLNIDVALVLDNTYSMSTATQTGTRLGDLKSASQTMLNIFHAADPKAVQIKVGIVPFSQYVNVGTLDNSLPGLDQATLTIPQQNCPKPLISKSGCTTKPTTRIKDGIAESGTSESCTSYVYGDPVCKWSGCVGSYDDKGDPLDDATTRYPAMLNTSCGSAITPLTADYTKLATALGKMTANNETYIAPGVLWGWKVLSPEPPFTEGRATSGNTRKIMVLMSDGTNTRSPTFPTHKGTNVAFADSRTIATCTNAKKTGITIYTISVGIDSDASVSTLTNCASEPSKALSISDTNRLEEVFRSIANEILTPRLIM